MIPYRAFPHLDIGFLQLHWYGVFAALGFLVAVLLARREARKRRIPEARIESLAIWLIVGGVIGARIGYILFYWPADLPLTFWSAIAVWAGGLAWFGGFVGALIVGTLYVLREKLDFWTYADLFTIPLIAGHIFGRIGDYITGGHPGTPTTLPWAIWLDGAARHPVVLYEIIGLLVILAIVIYLRSGKLPDGALFLSYVSLYSIQRLLLDFFRIETTDPRILGLTPSQWFVIVLLAIAVWLLARKRVKRRTVNS